MADFLERCLLYVEAGSLVVERRLIIYTRQVEIEKQLLADIPFLLMASTLKKRVRNLPNRGKFLPKSVLLRSV